MSSVNPEEKTMGEDAPREQDKFLPIANISRIMKDGLPKNAKISKDAKELVQQCVSDFIIFVTSEASDKCQREKRKTVNGDDILWAMRSLGFEDAVVVLTTYLQKIREAEGVEKNAKSAAAESNRDTSVPSSGPLSMVQGPGGQPMGPPGSMQGRYTVAYAPMPVHGQQGAAQQAVQQPMMMYMPVGSNGQQMQQMHMMPMSMPGPGGQPPAR